MNYNTKLRRATWIAAGIAAAALLVSGVAPAAAAGGERAGPVAARNPQGPVTRIPAAQVPLASAGISRASMYSRAQYWVSLNIPYNQNATHNANSAPVGPYRTDCSGFISMSWGLSSSLTTQTLPNVATSITKDQLQQGDILDYNSTRDPVNGSHVIMFVRWANPGHTSFVEDEEAGGIGAVQRTISYPYDGQMDGTGTWKPYRYTGVSGASSPSTPGLARYSGNAWTFYEYNYNSGAGITDQYVTWSGTLAGDKPLVGDWTGSGKSTPGLARFANGAWTFYEYNYNSGAGITDQYVTWSGTLATDVPLVGDWTGSGVSTPGLARFANGAWTFYEYNYNSGAGITDQYVTWSGTLAGDKPLVGDWTGSGKSTPGLARFSGNAWTFYEYNYNSGAGITDELVTWSGTLASDTPRVGSWTGTGIATPGLVRFSGSAWTFYEYNYNSGSGITDQYVTWSGTLAGDKPLVGSWT